MFKMMETTMKMIKQIKKDQAIVRTKIPLLPQKKRTLLNQKTKMLLNQDQEKKMKNLRRKPKMKFLSKNKKTLRYSKQLMVPNPLLMQLSIIYKLLLNLL